MANVTKTVDDATDQVVSLIEQAQEATASVLTSVSETVAKYVPQLGLGELVIHPQAAVETSFDVSSKFLDAGRNAALGVLGAVAPVTDKIFGETKKTAKPSAKSA